MQLVPKEVGRGSQALLVNSTDESAQLDKLTIANLGFLAQRRLARGVRLNHAEAVVCLRRSTACD